MYIFFLAKSTIELNFIIKFMILLKDEILRTLFYITKNRFLRIIMNLT